MEDVRMRDARIGFVPSEHIVADVMTKPLSMQSSQALRQLLCMQRWKFARGEVLTAVDLASLSDWNNSLIACVNQNWCLGTELF